MISFEDIRPQLKKFVQEGCETADYIMRVSKTPKDGIYAYEEMGEIVWCFDCEHFANDSEHGAFCNHFARPLHDDYDGFCAWGKRKEARDGSRP